MYWELPSLEQPVRKGRGNSTSIILNSAAFKFKLDFKFQIPFLFVLCILNHVVVIDINRLSTVFLATRRHVACVYAITVFWLIMPSV